VAGGQQAGQECAESEKRGGCEETTHGKNVVHPVGEEGAKNAVTRDADDHARGRAYKSNACCNPQHMRARRAQRQADAELRSALRDTVSGDAEDADQRQHERHGREDAKQNREEPLTPVLRVVLNGLVEGERAVEAAGGDLQVGSDGCDGGAHRVQVVEGTLQDFEALAGDLLDTQKDSVAVQDCFEDEHLECALREFDGFPESSPLSEIGEYTLSPFLSRRRPPQRLRLPEGSSCFALGVCDFSESIVDRSRLDQKSRNRQPVSELSAIRK
jgi:hypothetical protein